MPIKSYLIGKWPFPLRKYDIEVKSFVWTIKGNHLGKLKFDVHRALDLLSTGHCSPLLIYCKFKKNFELLIRKLFEIAYR